MITMEARSERRTKRRRENKIDADWFRERMMVAELRQNELAAKMGLDKAAMSRLVNGLRSTSIDEAVLLSDLLAVSLRDVLAHLGVPRHMLW